jgi:SAM-dependent methyltransferase
MLSLDRQNALREQYRTDNPEWQPATEVFAAAVRSFLDEDSQVLDVGCGRGGLVEQLGHPLSQIVGIDPDWLSLTQHRLSLPRCVAFSDGLPLPEASIDVAYASWVLEHLASPSADLNELARVLKPGGVFVFITPNVDHPLVQLNRVFGRMSIIQQRLVRFLYGRLEDDTFPVAYQANSVVELRWLAEDAGLALHTLEAVSDPTYMAFNAVLYRLMCRFEESLSAEKRLHFVGIMQKPL